MSSLPELLEFLPLVTYRVNEEGVILALNIAGEDELGYSKEELIGTKSSSLYAEPEKYAKEGERIRDEGGLSQTELTLRRKDGTLFHCLDRSRFVQPRDGPAYIEGFLQDVTQVKEALRKVQAKEREIRNLWNVTSEVLYTLNRENWVVRSNPAAVRTYGVDATVKPHKMIDLIPREHIAEVEAALEAIWESGGTPFPMLVRSQHVNGSRVILEISMQRDPDDPNLMHCVGRDLTLRYDREKELKRKSAALERIVDKLPVPLMTVDAKGKIVRTNDSTRSLIGDSQAIGSKLQSYFPTAKEQIGKAIADSSSVKAQGTTELNVTAVDNLSRFKLQFTPIGKDENLGSTLVVLTDLGDEEREALREKFYANWQQALYDTPVQEDIWTKLLPMMRETFGFEVGEVWGRSSLNHEIRQVTSNTSPESVFRRIAHMGKVLSYESDFLPLDHADAKPYTDELSEWGSWERTPSFTSANLTSCIILKMELQEGRQRFVLLAGTNPVAKNCWQIIEPIMAQIGLHLDRRVTQERLWRQQRVLQAQLDGAHEAILVVNSEGKVQALNSPMLKLCGIPMGPKDSSHEVFAIHENNPALINNIQHLYMDRTSPSADQVSLHGVDLVRRSVPVVGSNGESLGRVWYFHARD